MRLSPGALARAPGCASRKNRQVDGQENPLVVTEVNKLYEVGKYQSIIIENLCRPTWGYIIGQAIADGELPDDPKWNVTSWTTPKSVSTFPSSSAPRARGEFPRRLPPSDCSKSISDAGDPT